MIPHLGLYGSSVTFFPVTAPAQVPGGAAPHLDYRIRLAQGGEVALQAILIASGNLAFLNWLTLVPILACFDDGLWRRILPAALVARAEAASATAAPSRAQGLTVAVLAVGVAALSVAHQHRVAHFLLEARDEAHSSASTLAIAGTSAASPPPRMCQ